MPSVPSTSKTILSSGPSTESQALDSNTELTTLPTPIQGDGDWRRYKTVILPNGVTVCAVHDKESKTTAVAAAVQAGAALDPRSFPGLAHFLEHMCFLGSVKYPGENEYKSFLSQHGGRSNASTSLFLTTFQFEVLAAHANHAVDVFSQFFVCPLLSESGTEREVNAVDSENSRNKSIDGRRRLQILKDLCRPGHYYGKFTTGNVNTLWKRDENGIVDANDEDREVKQLRELRQALLCFHSTHYSSDRLTVVIVGPQSIEELMNMVIPRFEMMNTREQRKSSGSIDPIIEKLVLDSAGDAPPFGYPPTDLRFNNPLKDTSHQSLLVVSPVVKSQRQLVLMFPLPPFTSPDQSPVSILSHLLGHEGPGSAFSSLQDRQWITDLAAGSRMTAPDFTIFEIDLQLTDEGEKHWKDVVAVIFQYCQYLQKQASLTHSGRSKRLQEIWDESSTLSRIMFHQTSPGSAYVFAPSLCASLIRNGPEACLSAGRLLNESAETLPVDDLLDFTSRLTITNCLIERCSQRAWDEVKEQGSNASTAFYTEPWYGIDFYHTPLDLDDVEGWKNPGYKFLDARSLLELPCPNRYIPRTLDLFPIDTLIESRREPCIEKQIDPPSVLCSNHIGRLWHRLDDRYALPKSVLTILIRNAAVENERIGIDPTTGAIQWQYDDRLVVLSALLSGIYNQAQAQGTYDAELSGLNWSVSLGSDGIVIRCSGFSDRLPDLAIKILQDFVDGYFLKESHFHSTRDRVVRGLTTFLESRRADSDSMYYRDLLLSSNSHGVKETLKAAIASTLQSVQSHHQSLLDNEEAKVECFFTGNVSQEQASTLFDSVSTILLGARSSLPRETSYIPRVWYPGNAERRLTPGEDVEFHFSSQNPQEENGGILITYQSSIPGFCSDTLSSRESLHCSAAIRLLCRMLREPLFNELRTKQSLGYVVSSFYDFALSSRSSKEAFLGPQQVPVDSLVINVLSRKVSPPEVCQRIDVLLENFRESLKQMPESQIHHHASALSEQLLKPIQKLDVEASMHFSKISKFAPELMDRDGKSEEALPWNIAESLASTISGLQREDLIQAWDRLVLKQNRARIVSCVYGSTFPLDTYALMLRMSSSRFKLFVINDASKIVSSRHLFPIYDKSISTSITSRLSLSAYLGRASSSPSLAVGSAHSLQLVSAAILGAGVTYAGWTLLKNWRNATKC